MGWHELMDGTEEKTLKDLSAEKQQKYAEKMRELKETLSPDKIISDDTEQTLKEMQKAVRLAFTEVGGRAYIKEHRHTKGNEVDKLYGFNIEGRIGSYTIAQSVFDFDNLPSKLNMLVEDLGLGYFRENEGKVNCTRNGFMNWCNNFKPKGHFYGVNMETAHKIVCERKPNIEPNHLVLGEAGEGRGFYAKAPDAETVEDKIVPLKPFVCTVEEYSGNKTDCRVFAETAEQAREKLIKQFPKCYVSPAIPMKEYNSAEETFDSEDEPSLDEDEGMDLD